MDTNMIASHDNCTETCPVAYFMKIPDLVKNLICMECNNQDKLWFCIYCGHIGCGYSTQSHTVEHYQQTLHRYVLSLQTLLVFDYKTKRFLNPLNDEDKRKFDFFHNICNEFPGASNCLCVLCLYNRSPKLIERPACMACGYRDAQKLWMCLSCSYIGCSKYQNPHALLHHKKLKHDHAMQLENFSVWNYVEHAYINGHPRYSASINVPSEPNH